MWYIVYLSSLTIVYVSTHQYYCEEWLIDQVLDTDPDYKIMNEREFIHLVIEQSHTVE